MTYRKYRWSKNYEAAEEELEKLLSRLGHDLDRWELAAGDNLRPRKQLGSRCIWCAEGSIRLIISGQTIGLQPGDAIAIDSDQLVYGEAGVAGVVCYEAAKQPPRQLPRQEV